mmetsp:Transcript_30239/g.97503  ORF Transcript_30239/g.97503 Transcript_30239/m.97503 type:complete len:202 (-) Transcript_30239:132-737(-)
MPPWTASGRPRRARSSRRPAGSNEAKSSNSRRSTPNSPRSPWRSSKQKTSPSGRTSASCADGPSLPTASRRAAPSFDGRGPPGKASSASAAPTSSSAATATIAAPSTTIPTTSSRPSATKKAAACSPSGGPIAAAAAPPRGARPRRPTIPSTAAVDPGDRSLGLRGYRALFRERHPSFLALGVLQGRCDTADNHQGPVGSA